MTRTGSDLGYTRRAILSDEPRFDGVVAQLAALEDAVAVNVIDASGEPMILSEGHLRQTLASSNGPIEVETISRASFNGIMRGKLADLDRQAGRLRGALRSDYVEEAVSQIQALLQQLDQLMVLIDAFALQRREVAMDRPLALLVAGGQGVIKAVEARDNVACMDSLFYELSPALRELAALFTTVEQVPQKDDSPATETP
jgi:hypothetical protein